MGVGCLFLKDSVSLQIADLFLADEKPNWRRNVLGKEQMETEAAQGTNEWPIFYHYG